MSKVTVWTIVEYLAGALGLIWGLISLVGSVMVAIPALAAGLVMLPQTRSKIESRLNAEFTDWTLVGVYLSLMTASIFLMTWLQPLQ